MRETGESGSITDMIAGIGYPDVTDDLSDSGFQSKFRYGLFEFPADGDVLGTCIFAESALYASIRTDFALTQDIPVLLRYGELLVPVQGEQVRGVKSARYPDVLRAHLGTILA